MSELNLEVEHELFEVALVKNAPMLPRNRQQTLTGEIGATYVSAGTQHRWNGWLMARRAAPAQELSALPELPPLPDAFGQIDIYHDDGRVTSRSGYTNGQTQTYARAYGLLCRQQGGSDTARLDMLEAMAENGFVSMCFEVDGGVFLKLEGVSEEPIDYRNKNSIRDALDAAIQAQAGDAKNTPGGAE